MAMMDVWAISGYVCVWMTIMRAIFRFVVCVSMYGQTPKILVLLFNVPSSFLSDFIMRHCVTCVAMHCIGALYTCIERLHQIVRQYSSLFLIVSDINLNVLVTSTLT